MAFATTNDLQVRLGVTFTDTQAAQAAAFLDDATARLIADVLDGRTIAQGTSTEAFQVAPGDRWITPTGQPVTAVTSVSVAADTTGSPGWALIGGRVRLDWPAQSLTTAYTDVTVTYTHGLATVPADLKSWCLVLAASAMAAAARGNLGSAGGIQSETVGPFSVSYNASAAGGDAMAIPAQALARLRTRYGGGVYVSHPAS